MKFEKLPTSLLIAAVLIGLASVNGFISGLMAIINGTSFPLGFLSLILGIAGAYGAYLAISKKVVIPWVSYLWILPQILNVSTITYNKVEQIKEIALGYGTFLFPSITLSFGWDLSNGAYQAISLNLVAIWFIVFIGWAINRENGNDPL